MLKGREVVVGVTGGIAAYKAAEFVRLLVKAEANVHGVMTRNAQEFITPLTLQTLSGNPVTTDSFTLLEGTQIGHIALADVAELVVILPATANIIGKIAHGIADDFLSTMVIATKAPVLLAPSMNVNMWNNDVLQLNVRSLRERGYHLIDPGEGELACHWYGKGRLADLGDLLEKVEDLFTPKDLAGENVLVTAGPTHEPIDPIRFISNRSSGKMGYALAREASRRGAKVVLITGPTSLPSPRQEIEVISVRTAEEMKRAVLDRFEGCSVVIKAAAVADYRPKEVSATKLKKTHLTLSLELERTVDILEQLGKMKKGQILVGFAAESDDLVANARQKMLKKNLNMIVANEVSESFGLDTNRVKVIHSRGEIEAWPEMSKEALATKILDDVIRLIHMKRSGGTSPH